MAKRQGYYRTNYTDGNNARKLTRKEEYERLDYGQSDYEEQRERYREKEPERRKVKRTVHRSRAKHRGLDLISLLFFTGAIIVTVYVCVDFLKAQASATTVSKSIALLQSEIAGLKNENEESWGKIDESVDLAHIYQVATEELGMVHANKNQVIEYESTKSNTVKQYGDIPEETKKGFLDFLKDR